MKEFPMPEYTREGGRERMRLLTFGSYEQYVETQTQTNRRKLKKVWVTPKELRAVARYVRRHIPGASFGLCHGVRNGYEVGRLRDLLGIEVLGTEISDTANQFEHVIQWDYHEVKPEWRGGGGVFSSTTRGPHP